MGLGYIGGPLHLKNLQNIVSSYKLKFNIWVGSNKWLLRYSIFNILRSSSMGGRLHWSICTLCFGPLSLSLKFRYDPTSGCWVTIHFHEGRVWQKPLTVYYSSIWASCIVEDYKFYFFLTSCPQPLFNEDIWAPSSKLGHIGTLLRLRYTLFCFLDSKYEVI